MNPEEIQQQIELLQQRVNQRNTQLQINDAQLQSLVGQIQAYRSVLGETQNTPILENKNESEETY